MKPVLLYILAVFLLLQACNNGQQTARNTTNTTDAATAQPHPEPITEQWYKHFTGTIGTSPVVIDLCSYADEREPGDEGLFTSAGGTCVYSNRNTTTTLTLTTIRGDSLFIVEHDSTSLAYWVLVRHGDTMVGQWKTTDSPAFGISLREDYTQGSCPLSVIEHSEKCAVDWGDEDTSHFKVSLMVLAPASNINSDDGAFFNKELVAMLSGDTVGATTVEQYASLMALEYVKRYKQHVAEDRNAGMEYSATYDNEVKLRTECAYNNNGLLEFIFTAYGYEGGAHGQMQTTTACLDMKEKKVLQLRDIFIAGANITPLLKKEAAKALEVAPGEKLSDKLLVETLAPSPNFIVTGSSISFYYSQGEIAGNVYGDIMLEVPLAKIKDQLTPQFRQRMGI